MARHQHDVRLISLLLLVTACGDQLAGRDAEIERTQVALIPAVANRDVDILFVIDNSVAFLDTQNQFRLAATSLLGELSTLPGGMPNLHLGVVSGDLGAQGTLDIEPGPSIGSGPGSCAGTGMGGTLVTNGAPVTDAFIRDVAAADGSRDVNYTGSLPDVFSQMAALGSGGCGFQQHLAAMMHALRDSPGFVRTSATLAVIVLTDDDDCSFMHSTLLGSDPSLGRLSTFRCVQFGVTCDQDMTEVGDKTGCHSNEQSAYLEAIGEYQAALEGLKSDPRDVLFATVSGPTYPFAVELRVPPGGGTSSPALKLACVTQDGINPSVRLPELARRMSRPGVVESDCTTDFAPVQARIGRHVRNLVGDSCLPDPIAPGTDCTVVAQARDGSETIVPFTFVADPSCTGSGMRLAVDLVASSDVMYAVRCTIP